MLKRTPLYELHQASNAQLVDFSGWEMPLHYGSQIEEHHTVRQAAGIFDVSHMGVLDIEGAGTVDFLRYALANDVQKLPEDGKALYSCLLNEQGGVIDDLIAYRVTDTHFRLVLNAGRRDVDIAWLQKLVVDFDVTLTEQKNLCIIALQGPAVMSLLNKIIPDLPASFSNVKPFHFIFSNNLQIARTGYTGEDGVEVILPAEEAKQLWQKAIDADVKPCGLGSRDTLRLEAGMNLYGVDMNESTSPLTSNLSWTVSFKDEARNFVGRDALLTEKEKGIAQKLVGVVMTDPGVLRNHQPVSVNGDGEGEITSGSFSPTLGHAIALARVPFDAGDEGSIERRGKKISVAFVKPPFVRLGEKVF